MFRAGKELKKLTENPILKDFREFALKGNVLDMAVGIIVGAAFTGVVNSFVKDILTPPLGLLQHGAGRVGDLSQTWNIPLGSAVNIQVGAFINTVVQFFLTAFAVFVLVRGINRLRQTPPPPGPTTKTCPYCISTIPVRATRCAHCTSELEPVKV